MDRKELIKTLNILKIQPNSYKGFSFRRTLKTLHDHQKNKPIIDFKNQLINAKEVDLNGERGY